MFIKNSRDALALAQKQAEMQRKQDEHLLSVQKAQLMMDSLAMPTIPLSSQYLNRTGYTRHVPNDPTIKDNILSTKELNKYVLDNLPFEPRTKYDEGLDLTKTLLHYFNFNNSKAFAFSVPRFNILINEYVHFEKLDCLTVVIPFNSELYGLNDRLQTSRLLRSNLLSDLTINNNSGVKPWL